MNPTEPSSTYAFLKSARQHGLSGMGWVLQGETTYTGLPEAHEQPHF